ncbi:uncharacterized protein (DUF2249 family) [Granulicella aggregans]|uniref:Uncharacterized protein (DUF2249 family) n=2 Tax=Granulicella aggregans TaxID=474949 RepID=A0A7W8E8N5_9BACT|nr:uncharacterized protein (DUF2249 family) [Granulicella aggregans]
MATGAQQPVRPSSRQSAVIAKVSTLQAGDKISVVFMQAPERYGTFQSSRQDDFTFHDVDQDGDVTFPYADVKKVKSGYGGYNSLTHKHTDHTKAYIGIGIATGLIVAVIVAAAAAKN